MIGMHDGGMHDGGMHDGGWVLDRVGGREGVPGGGEGRAVTGTSRWTDLFLPTGVARVEECAGE